MTKIWVHFKDRHDLQQDALAVLTAAGIDSVPLTAFPEGAGIIFFECNSAELCDFVSLASKRGRERVVTISVSKQAGENFGNWSLLHAGASDVLHWEKVRSRAEDLADRFARWKEIDELIDSPLVTENLVGRSHLWKSTMRQIVEVAQFTDAPMLLTGESGTGKELVARLVHTLDRRKRKRDLIVLDCTTIVPGLSGSEFFGHERGAFTGASTSRDGAFALADGGTLFLDEVGELSQELQAQLLRVVQEKSFKRVGGNSWQNTEFRLVCATNRDLLQEVKCGRFRHDLYYRLAGWECRLPPLRERSEDILLLARHFMTHSRADAKVPELDRAVQEYLMRREYPGNVRDLKLLMNRIMYRQVGNGPVTIGMIPADERPRCDAPSPWCDEQFETAIRRALSSGAGLKEIGRTAEDTAVNIVVHAEEGNLRRAAKRLGVTDRALQLRRAARQNELFDEESKNSGYDAALPPSAASSGEKAAYVVP